MNELVITKIEKYKNNFKIFINEKFYKTIIYDTFIKFDLYEEAIISEDILNKIIEFDNIARFKNLAINYAKKRFVTKSDIYNYLTKKNCDKKIIDLIINNLVDMNLIDDKKYIEVYFNDKISINRYSIYKIKSNLILKKINKDLIEDYIFNNQDELNKIETENIKYFLEKKLDSIIKKINNKRNKMNEIIENDDFIDYDEYEIRNELKMELKNYLKSRYFNYELINLVLDDYSYDI